MVDGLPLLLCLLVRILLYPLEVRCSIFCSCFVFCFRFINIYADYSTPNVIKEYRIQ